jgi:hypothetical protein
MKTGILDCDNVRRGYRGHNLFPVAMCPLLYAPLSHVPVLILLWLSFDFAITLHIRFIETCDDEFPMNSQRIPNESCASGRKDEEKQLVLYVQKTRRVATMSAISQDLSSAGMSAAIEANGVGVFKL